MPQNPHQRANDLVRGMRDNCSRDFNDDRHHLLGPGGVDRRPARRTDLARSAVQRLVVPAYDADAPALRMLARRIAMERDNLNELHCIMPIKNIPSVMKAGILSHRRAAAVQHDTVADPEIQARRARVRVPGGRPLHEYANLYFDARNPMMYRRKGRHAELAVLSIDTAVLDLPGVVITDRNASVDEDLLRFAPAPGGLAIVNDDLTFAEYWTHDDFYEGLRRKQAKQAEVLVPDRVKPEFIRGAYVSCAEGRDALAALDTGCRIKVRPRLFFRS